MQSLAQPKSKTHVKTALKDTALEVQLNVEVDDVDFETYLGRQETQLRNTVSNCQQTLG